MSYQQLTTPSVEPLHLDEVKAHLRVTVTSEDDLIDNINRAAREKAEGFLKRALVMRKYVMRLDHFTHMIKPEYTPLVKVHSITYVDTNGDTQTLADTVYTVDRYREPAEIFEAYNEDFPTVRDVANAVQITFTAGYMAPFTVNTGTDILTVANNPFSNGDVVRLYVTGGETKALPTGLSVNTDYYVIETSSNTFKLSTTSNGSAVDITASGTGFFFIGYEVFPQPILQAIKLMQTDWYYNRGNVDQVMPKASYNLLMPYTLDVF